MWRYPKAILYYSEKVPNAKKFTSPKTQNNRNMNLIGTMSETLTINNKIMEPMGH